jgi:uncharacterized protein YegP (UPF0339 family)
VDAEFQVYQDRAGYWRWRLWSIGNSKTVADSGEGYYSAENAERAVAWVKYYAPHAPVRRV